jgi:hypothetical protein
VVYGHQEMVVGTVSLLLEAGMIPLLCATPAGSGRLSNILKGMTPEWTSSCLVRQADSLAELETHLVGLRADVLMAGPDAGPLAQRLGLPLVSSVGLSARSASDAGRLRIGYRGALQTIGQLLALFGSR